MEIKPAVADEKRVYLNTVASQMGLEISGTSLYVRRWWGRRDVLDWSDAPDGTITAKGYGLPRTVILFCSHLEKTYGAKVALEFVSDEPCLPRCFLL